MKNKFILSIIAITITATILYSCKKDVSGCMDKDSVNYNSSATKDDGSCKYQGKVVYWWKQAMADSCAANGVSTIKVYLNGTFQGTLPVSSQSWSAAPSCGASSTVTATIDLGTSKSKSVAEKMEAYDGSGNLLLSTTDNITLTANTCVSYEQTW